MAVTVRLVLEVELDDATTNEADAADVELSLRASLGKLQELGDDALGAMLDGSVRVFTERGVKRAL